MRISKTWAVSSPCRSFVWWITESILVRNNSILFSMYLVWDDANKNKLGVQLNKIQYVKLVCWCLRQWQWLRGEQWDWKGRQCRAGTACCSQLRRSSGSLIKWEQEGENKKKGWWGETGEGWERWESGASWLARKCNTHLQVEGGRGRRGGAAGGGGGREGAGSCCCSGGTAGWRHGRESRHLPARDLEQPHLESAGKEGNKSGVTTVESKKTFFVLRKGE